MASSVLATHMRLGEGAGGYAGNRLLIGGRQFLVTGEIHSILDTAILVGDAGVHEGAKDAVTYRQTLHRRLFDASEKPQ